MNVERALRLLRQCAYLFWDDDGTDEIGALLAEARACYDAAGNADPATVAIGRSLIAAYELRLCTDVEHRVNSGWDYDWDGPPFNGAQEEDWDEVTGPAADRAASAARAAIDADPGDPLVPVHLAHALSWLGDRDGAVAAYREALRRDPGDDLARTCLRALEADLSPLPEPVPRSYSFVLLRRRFRITNSDWGETGHVFGALAAARPAADAMLADSTGALFREELDGRLELELSVHRPSLPITSTDLMTRVPRDPDEGPFRIDWTDIQGTDTTEPLLPPGRPVRIGNLLCF
ncbi:tetratricopeptide repeat protein [Actinomadura roseirufa]|uniref:tetratricopeptide repeat protein n=1 Tax=Actinomadura roseirufa TaxID=2094049 RepID=UPI0013F14681|nr:tetratricopeptide repeat protein [Actinomadura roseirufa]